MRRLLLLLILGLVAEVGCATCDSSSPPTATTRLGLSQPVINACNWGTTLNQDFSILDSSVACLACNQTFTGTNHFASALFIDSGNGLALNNSNNTAASGLENFGASGKEQIKVIAPNGVAFNGTALDPQSGWPSVLVYPTIYENQATFAIAESSANGSFAYSGFVGTGPINQSVLWSLPKNDGQTYTPIVTDGNAHLSFSQVLNASAISGGLYVGTGTFTSADPFNSQMDIFGVDLDSYSLVVATHSASGIVGPPALSISTSGVVALGGGLVLWNLPKATINLTVAKSTGTMVYCTDCAANGGKGTVCVSTGSTATYQFTLSTGTRCQ